MKTVENLRYWFACNSSSTHSVVFYPDRKLEDELCEDGEFGWQPFVAASDEMKRSYLASILDHRLDYLGDGDASETAKMIVDHLFPSVMTGFIDHQSVPVIPRRYGSSEPHYDFFHEMVSYVMREGVVIHGGNDNGDINDNTTPPATNIEWYRQIPLDSRDDKWVCRQEGDWWLLFNHEEGIKATVSFEDNPRPRPYAMVPELVDLKITDFCPYACPWCYQGSTHKGGFAENVSSWLYAFHRMGVFEVAIGGGEPTLHPEFKQIVGHSLTDLRVNFSTRNLDWVCHNARLIREHCGGFAFSVDGDLHKHLDVIRALKEAELLEKATLQYVMGTGTDYDFENLVEDCSKHNVRLTLLGYKVTGRGAHARGNLPVTPVQDGDEWIEIVNKHSYNLAIDTTLAARVPKEVFDETLLRRTEGTHSMYVDAVTSTAGPSSYVPQNEMVSLSGRRLQESLLNAFESFQTRSTK